MKVRKIRNMIVTALLLSAVSSAVVVYGQADNFFYMEEVMRDNDDVGSWNSFGFGGPLAENEATWDELAFSGIGQENGATWEGFEFADPLPLGGGLLVLALSCACYAGAKKLKGKK